MTGTSSLPCAHPVRGARASVQRSPDCDQVPLLRGIQQRSAPCRHQLPPVKARPQLSLPAVSLAPGCIDTESGRSRRGFEEQPRHRSPSLCSKTVSLFWGGVPKENPPLTLERACRNLLEHLVIPCIRRPAHTNNPQLALMQHPMRTCLATYLEGNGRSVFGPGLRLAEVEGRS